MSEVAESGCALLLVTHDRELAAAVTDHRLELGDPRSASRSALPDPPEAGHEPSGAGRVLPPLGTVNPL